ncbi:MAG: SHOCT domain-containing protein [Candidatus Micrarchaeaceae archaeon]
MAVAKFAALPVAVIIIAVIAAALLVISAFVLAPGPFFMMGFAPFFGFIGLLWILFWIALIMWFLRLVFGYGMRVSPWRSEERSEQIAKERYARGEITRKEFEEIMRKLHEY